MCAGRPLTSKVLEPLGGLILGMLARRSVVLLLVPALIVGGLIIAGFFLAPTRVLHIAFETDQPVYAPGEVVVFTLRNDRSDTALLPASAPWKVERQIDGLWHSVERHSSPRNIVPVEPGATLQWSWKAETHPDDPSLVPVSEGHYRVRLTVQVEGVWIGLVARFDLASV